MTIPEQSPTPQSIFGHVLVPLDGSRLAEVVLPAVTELARRCHTRITLLHVLEQGAPSTIHGERHLTDAQTAAEYLAKLSQSLTDEGLTVDFHVHPNLERDVVASIVWHADEMGDNLVALATHGSGGLRDVIIGSIAEQVIGRGSAPVLLIRSEPMSKTAGFVIQRILVPLDGTPDSERALPLAEAMAQAWAAPLVLLRVVPTRESLNPEQAAVATVLPGATAAALEIEQQTAALYLDSLMTELRDRGFDVSAEVLRGDPTSRVLETARRQSVGMVVMATHGRSGLDAFWSGSIGHRLAERLTVPLLIVRSDRPRQ